MVRANMGTYIAVNIAPMYNAPMVGAILVACSTKRELSIAGMLSRELVMKWLKSKCGSDTEALYPMRTEYII